MSAYGHRGHVYFAACGKYVKIGYTSQAVDQRIKSLPGKVKVPADFDPADTVWLLGAIPGCITRDERRLHDLFAPHHVEGEWFYMSPDFLGQFESLRYLTYAAERLAFRRARADLRRAGIAAYAGVDIKPSRPIGIRNANQHLADTG